MTTYDNARTASSASSFGGFLSNIIGSIAAWNDARATRKSLSALTARELDDIGLSRGDIELVATRGTRF